MTDVFEYTKEFVVSSSLIDSVWFNENDNTVVLDVDDELYRYYGVTGFDVSALVAGENGSVGAYYNKHFKKRFGPGEDLGAWWENQAVQVLVSRPGVGVAKDLTENNVAVPKALTTQDADAFDTDGTKFKVGQRVMIEYLGYDDEDIKWSGPGTVVQDVSDLTGIYIVRSDSRQDEGGFYAEQLSALDEPTKEYSLSDPVASVTINPATDVVSLPTKEYSLSFEDEAPAVEEAEGLESATEIVVHFTLNDFDNKFKYTAVEATTVEGAIDELNDYVSRMGAKGRVRKVVVKF